MRTFTGNSVSTLLHALAAGGIWWLESSEMLVLPELATVKRGEAVVIQLSFSEPVPATPQETAAIVTEVVPPAPPLELEMRPMEPITLPDPEVQLPRPTELAEKPLGEIEVVELELTRPDADSVEVRRSQANTSEMQDELPQENFPPKLTQRTTRAVESTATETIVAIAEPGSQAIDPPRKMATNPPFQYPEVARRERAEGRVEVLATIDPTGKVSSAEVKLSSGHAALDASAVETILRWRFEPARRLGTAVAYEILVPVRFQFRQQ